MNSNGQSAAELMIVIAAVMFFFAAFLFALQFQLSDKYKEKQNLELQDTALYLENEIRLASSSSEGFSRNFKLPLKIYNKDYQISIEADLIYIRLLDGSGAAAFPITNVTGQPVIGDNIIRKVDGQVFLNS